MPNPSQEPLAPSKSPSEDLVDMGVVCTIKIHDPKSQSGTSSILQCPNQDLKDMKVLCTLKTSVDSQNFELWCIKEQ